MMKPIVSISCITYNHAPYIRQALDSFLMQRDVPFEVLIHDDCSTDGTVEILREYEEKFPDVIKVMYEEENQYSKGISNISGVFNFPRASGRYIAMCEGDDFWNDRYKLFKQTEYLDSHPECSMVVHSAHILSEDSAYRSSELIRPCNEFRDLTPEEVISKPVNFPMASLMFPAEAAKNLPRWYYDCPVGDIPLHLFMLMNGTVHYMDEPMSTYRMGRAGSWGNAMDSAGNSADGNGVDPAGAAAAEAGKWESHYNAMEKLYQAFNEDTKGIYSVYTEDALRRSRFLIDLKEGKFDAVKNRGNVKYLNELPAAEGRLLKLRAKAPGIYGLLQRTYKSFTK